MNATPPNGRDAAFPFHQPDPDPGNAAFGWTEYGLSKREYFAVTILAAFVQDYSGERFRLIDSEKEMVEKSVSLADALLRRLLIDESQLALLGAPAAGYAPTAEDDAHDAADLAAGFLLALLTAGPVPSTEVIAKATEAGIRIRPLRMAKEFLGVQSKSLNVHGGLYWCWQLPEKPAGA